MEPAPLPNELLTHDGQRREKTMGKGEHPAKEEALRRISDPKDE